MGGRGSRFGAEHASVYGRTPQNISRLAAALKDLKPYPRGAPPGLPFRFDEATISAGLNFTFDTALGPVDCLGEIVGGGTYEQLLPFTQGISTSSGEVVCVTLDRLIQLKKACRRPKDLEVLAELQSLVDQRDDPSRGR